MNVNGIDSRRQQFIRKHQSHVQRNERGENLIAIYKKKSHAESKNT